MDINPRDVLNEAREASANKEYAIALEKYQWFFENSIKINPSFYGVRLSYCLNEWADLGQEYSPAKDALIKLKAQSLENFNTTFSFKHFHEYSSIARYLENQEEVFNEFLKIRESKPELAIDLFTFVYEYCTSSKLWELCREYLGDGKDQYAKELEMFDHMLSFAKERPEDERQSIYDDSCDRFTAEIIHILTMLHYSNSLVECNEIQSQLKLDLKKRDMEYLYLKIYSNFSGRELE